MEREKRSVQKHLFICTNIKENGECCGAKGSQELVSSLKAELRANNKYDDIKVSGTSCLGPCAKGISAVLYPENDQLTQLSKESFKELYQILLNDNDS